jgi:hypothetical protein
MIIFTQTKLLTAEVRMFWRFACGYGPLPMNGHFFKIDGRRGKFLHGQYLLNDEDYLTPPTEFKAKHAYTAQSEVRFTAPIKKFSIIYGGNVWDNAAELPDNVSYGDVLFMESNIESHSQQVLPPSYPLLSKAQRVQNALR